MISALINTCVWLDLAQDSMQAPLLLVVENMVRSGDLELIVPKVVTDDLALLPGLLCGLYPLLDRLGEDLLDTSRRLKG